MTRRGLAKYSLVFWPTLMQAAVCKPKLQIFKPDVRNGLDYGLKSYIYLDLPAAARLRFEFSPEVY